MVSVMRFNASALVQFETAGGRLLTEAFHIPANINWSHAASQVFLPLPDWSLLMNPQIGGAIAEELATPAEVRLREAQAAEDRSTHLLEKLEKMPLKTDSTRKIAENVQRYRFQKRKGMAENISDMLKGEKGSSHVSSGDISGMKKTENGIIARSKKELYEKNKILLKKQGAFSGSR